MTDDRRTPMQQPQWDRQEIDLDEQETVFADPEGKTPPTIPLDEQGGWGAVPEPVSELPTPSGSQTPVSQQQWFPWEPDHPEGPVEQSAQTMLISERPSPVFAWLVVVDGPAEMRGDIGKVYTLQPISTAIGRVQGNHIVIRDSCCSAQHARIRIESKEDEESALVLYEMGSSNGTFIGDKESYRDEENRRYRHELQDGDYILIGETTLAFKKL